MLVASNIKLTQLIIIQIKALQLQFFCRVGSLTADDVISFTVSNYDEDFDGAEKDNAWLRR